MKKQREAFGKVRGVFEKVPGTGVWWIQYFDGAGKRRREKVGKKSSACKLAEKRRSDVRSGVKLPDNFRAKAVTFGEIAARALVWSRAEKKSYHSDELRMKALLAEFGNQPAEQITAGDIRCWLDSRAPKWCLATRNRYCALLKMTYRVGEQYGLIKINPARGVQQKKENNGCIRYITDAEELLLRDVIMKSYSEHLSELEVALMTGMRQSEQFSLTWDRVDLGAGVIRLQDTKNNEGRFVRLNTRGLAALASLRDRDLGTGVCSS